jgi:protein-disulfide isomerase
MKRAGVSWTPLAAPVRKRDHVRGAAHPTVTLVAYGDFANPHCVQAYRAVKRVEKKMGHALRYVFRSFPTGEEGEPKKAAEAAECAGAQGRSATWKRSFGSRCFSETSGR